MNRIRMRSRDYQYLVEDQDNVFGMARMKRIRKEDVRFKYQRIKSGLQLYPEKVPLNEIIKIT